ncbi:MAG: hypothetical protein L3K09_04165 [Thermoplasmata archaeon]|nr:hypothetical protein [Thermoplasmata archaeon]
MLTGAELRISARLLLHISRQPQFAPRETVPEALTQAGMAETLGVSQGAISSALTRLVDGGVLRVGLNHVRGRFKRLKVYQLTPEGMSIVRHIRASMGVYSRVVTVPFPSGPVPPDSRGSTNRDTSPS